jgi:hypothetical protein
MFVIVGASMCKHMQACGVVLTGGAEHRSLLACGGVALWVRDEVTAPQNLDLV